jgi:hypothetical protein
VVVKEFCLLGYNTMQYVASQRTFQRNVSPSSSGLKSKSGKKSALFAACFMLVSCLAYSSTLKMEATCSSKTLADFQLTTLWYILKDRRPLDLRLYIKYYRYNFRFSQYYLFPYFRFSPNAFKEAQI